MGYEEVRAAALALSIEDRIQLRRLLARSVSREDPPAIDIDPATVIREAEDITGGRCHDRCRIYPNVFARYLTAYRLRLAGLKMEVIAGSLGVSRTEIYHCCKRMDAVLTVPRAWPEAVRYWNELIKRIPL